MRGTRTLDFQALGSVPATHHIPSATHAPMGLLVKRAAFFCTSGAAVRAGNAQVSLCCFVNESPAMKGNRSENKQNKQTKNKTKQKDQKNQESKETQFRHARVKQRVRPK